MELFEEIMETGEDDIPNYKVFINRKWVYSSSKQFINVMNPANGKVIGRVPSLTKKDVEKAIDAAYNNKITIRKIPGIGREGIGYSIDEMSKIHTIVFSLPPKSKPYGR